MKKAKKLICLMLTLVMLMGMMTAIPVSAVTESGIDLSDKTLMTFMSWKATAEDDCTDNAAVPCGDSWGTEIVTETIDGNTDKAFRGTITTQKWQMGPIAKNPSDTTGWTGFTDGYTSDKIVEISMDMAVSQLGCNYSDIFRARTHTDSFGGFIVDSVGNITYRNKNWVNVDTNIDMTINNYVNLKMIIDCANDTVYYYIDNNFVAKEIHASGLCSNLKTFQTVADARTSGETVYIYMDNVTLNMYETCDAIEDRLIVSDASWEVSDFNEDNQTYFATQGTITYSKLADAPYSWNKVMTSQNTNDNIGVVTVPKSSENISLADLNTNTEKGKIAAEDVNGGILEAKVKFAYMDVKENAYSILAPQIWGNAGPEVTIKNMTLQVYGKNTGLSLLKSWSFCELRVLYDFKNEIAHYYFTGTDANGTEINNVKIYELKSKDVWNQPIRNHKSDDATNSIYFRNIATKNTGVDKNYPYLLIDDISMKVYQPGPITFEAESGQNKITNFNEIDTDLKIKGTVPASLMDSEVCTVYAGLFKDNELCAVATNNVSKSKVSYELNFGTLEDAPGVKAGNYELKIFVFDTALRPILLTPKTDVLSK